MSDPLPKDVIGHHSPAAKEAIVSPAASKRRNFGPASRENPPALSMNASGLGIGPQAVAKPTATALRADVLVENEARPPKRPRRTVPARSSNLSYWDPATPQGHLSRRLHRLPLPNLPMTLRLGQHMPR